MSKIKDAMEAEKNYSFEEYGSDALTRPRDIAWDTWASFSEIGSMVQGYIRDVFYRKADGEFKEQRGITLEQQDGKLINIGIKRISWILAKTDNLRLGDPLTVVFEKQNEPRQKGYKGVKIFGYYGKNLESTAENKTVRTLEMEDIAAQDAMPENGEDEKIDGEEEKGSTLSDFKG